MVNIHFPDIDECAEFGHNCSQVCTNMEGSYQCSCHFGFVSYGPHCVANGMFLVYICNFLMYWICDWHNWTDFSKLAHLFLFNVLTVNPFATNNGYMCFISCTKSLSFKFLLLMLLLLCFDLFKGQGSGDGLTFQMFFMPIKF